MDYKEKYEQALEVAQRFYNNSVAITKKGLEDIFPELAGSEDERIRKRIIDLIKEVIEDDSYHVYRFDEMIAWLEKQGEKAKYHDICDKCVRQPTCQSDCFLQQSEQKPADKVEPKFKVGDKIKLAKEPKYPAREIIAIKNDAYYFDELVRLPLRYQDNWELVEEPKKCMFTKEEFTEEDRKILCEDCEEECEYAKKEEPVSEDLGDYINELSKQFPEVSFAKLSRIAVRVAKWQKEQIMKDATEAIVKVDAGGYPYIPQIELYDYDKDVPLAKEGEKYKVILIKEE